MVVKKIQKFIRSTKSSSPTPNSGAKGLSLIGDNFMCIETSSNIYGQNVFCSFERTDTIQISNIKISDKDFQQEVVNQGVALEFSFY